MHPGHLTSTTDQPPLFFCYNRQQKDIIYTNQSPIIFFGSAITNWNELILFQAPEWKSCLLLAPNKSLSFMVDEGGRRFHCRATSVEIQGGAGFEPVLMCSVGKENQQPMADLSKEYEEFVHLAAHDLDAPLRKLTMLIERLAAKIGEGGEGVEYIPRITSNLADMRAMVDGLSKLAGTYSGPKMQQQVDTGEMIKRIVHSLSKKYADREINVGMVQMPVVTGDPEAYYCLLHNLLENAVRFSKNGMPVSISVSSEEATPEEKRDHSLQNGIIFYKISVRDKGIGFNQEDAGKIFQPFTRLHGKSEYPGSGMGLAICKRIVESYGGVIYGEGIENEGAGIILFLPQSLN
jgi:light-regulated signal transduction histidine kinase (bacteriophytochrome)